MTNDVERINKLLSGRFLTFVTSVNVSCGEVFLGRWYSRGSDCYGDQLLYQLVLGCNRPVMWCETISIIITQDVYVQVLPKLVKLRATLPHLFSSDLP